MNSSKVSGGVSSVIIFPTHVLKRYNFKYIIGCGTTFPFFLTEICCLNILKDERYFPKILDVSLILSQSKIFKGVAIKMENLGNPISVLNGNYMKYFVSILEQVKILHSHHIVHCDLKSNNILMDESDNIHIIDFSHSKIMSDDTTLPYCDTLLQTPTIMSPEITDGTDIISYKVDVWSLGCVLYEMITGVELFQRCNDKYDIIHELERKNYIYKIEKYVENEFDRKLLKYILKENPYERPDIDDILIYISQGTVRAPKPFTLTYSCSDFVYDYVDDILEIILRTVVSKTDEIRHTYNIIARCIISSLMTNDECYVVDTDKYKTANIVEEIVHITRNVNMYECFAKWY